MLPGFTNHLINPDFFFTDFGTAARSTTGYVVPRWKLELGGAAAATGQPTTLPADIGQDKWLRGKSGLTLNVTTLGAGNSAKLTQRIEGGDRFSRQPARVTVVLYGPDGGTLRYGIGATSRIVTTLGSTTAVTATYAETVDDPSTEYLEVTLEPLTLGAFQIAFIQVDWPDDLAAPPSLELRGRQVERLLLNRYVHTVRVGTPVVLGSATQNMAVTFPATMRAVPVIATSATSVTLKEISTGNSLTVAAPTYALFDASVTGCRIRISGAPAAQPPATSAGYVTTESLVVLNADY
ncbi:hypothetical protein QFZ30_002475 [Arthrobacter pascens]|uniref:hypothetical protein n=1 Tax=Arthrobacter pascens TaxID=1677 RepID=UPI0027927368|nr:hypothetical protein [Arthrobacter pascens]MDQ0679093.1 hypothetical protein [Arthrobacter pascens]